MVYSAGPKEKKKGNHTTFTYPDGTVTSDGRSSPDFMKLQTLRTGRPRECFGGWNYDLCPNRRPHLLPDRVPEPDLPGYSRYVLVDEWEEKLPLSLFRFVGADGQVYNGKSDVEGRTQPLPDTAHPLRKVEFPLRNRWWAQCQTWANEDPCK
ncbi:hypothetical protein D3C76_1289420 [compost metagenome]